MAYSAAWSEAIPAGSLSSMDLDNAIRDAKRDIRERMASVFGMADWSADPLVIQYVAIGASPAQSGSLRVANNVAAVVARNAADSADIILSKLTAANLIELGAGSIQVDPATGFAKFTAIQTKFINNAALMWRNFADNADLNVLAVGITNNLIVGLGAASLELRPPKMGFFGAAAVVQATVTGAKGGNAALTSLMAAIGNAGYGLVNDTTT